MIVRVGDGKQYYMNKRLVKELDKIKKKVQQKDKDYVIVVDGAEGSGKSVFAMQIGKYLDNNLNLNDIHMNPESFKKGIEVSQQHKCQIFDEAYFGLSSRASLSAINKILVSKMMQMRQKNLFIIIVIPTFFLLDRYVSLFRSNLLFHIYDRKEVHYWLGFNLNNKKLLYLKGRKTMSYQNPRIYTFKGQFRGKYALDETEYRKKKMKALEQEDISEVESRFKQQRDILLCDFVKRNKLSYRKAEKELKRMNFSLSYPQISQICRKIPQNYLNV